MYAQAYKQRVHIKSMVVFTRIYTHMIGEKPEFSVKYTDIHSNKGKMNGWNTHTSVSISKYSHVYNTHVHTILLQLLQNTDVRCLPNIIHNIHTRTHSYVKKSFFPVFLLNFSMYFFLIFSDMIFLLSSQRQNRIDIYMLNNDDVRLCLLHTMSQRHRDTHSIEREKTWYWFLRKQYVCHREAIHFGISYLKTDQHLSRCKRT